VNQQPTYLHVVVCGENSRGNVTRYMEQVLRECTARQCFRVLVEERLEGPRLGTMQIFDMVATGSERFLGVFKALAYVDVNAQGDLMRFAENVAVNRAIPVRVFQTVAGAEKWLLDEQRGPSAAV
jgi:hypothetical protein